MFKVKQILMNNIKVNFSIKDLENLTGIKAHTIRIWEKRYNLLSPNRTDTNIRNYSITSFQKLLNISYCAFAHGFASHCSLPLPQLFDGSQIASKEGE